VALRMTEPMFNMATIMSVLISGHCRKHSLLCECKNATRKPRYSSPDANVTIFNASAGALQSRVPTSGVFDKLANNYALQKEPMGITAQQNRTSHFSLSRVQPTIGPTGRNT
jgi:hypothetical protein